MDFVSRMFCLHIEDKIYLHFFHIVEPISRYGQVVSSVWNLAMTPEGNDITTHLVEFGLEINHAILFLFFLCLYL